MSKPSIPLPGLMLLALSFATAATGCRDETPEAPRIVLPETPVLSIETSWAVITSSHLRLREQPLADAAIITTLWRGYVLEVLAKQNRIDTVENQENYWYQVGFDGLQGWVFGAYLDLFSSRDAALAAGESLRK
jgi:hypothetical protein